MIEFSYPTFFWGMAAGAPVGGLIIIALTELLPRAAFKVMGLSSTPDPEDQPFADADDYAIKSWE